MTVKKAASSKAAAKKPAAKKTATKKAAAKKTVSKPKSASAPKKAAKKSSKKVTPISDQQRYEMIQEAAYYLAEEAGFSGDQAQYWAQAEATINSHYPV